MCRTRLVYLSIVLVMAMVAAGCGPQPTATPVPTSTPAPTQTPAVQLGPEQRVEPGGFSFQPIPDYEMAMFWGDAFMAAPDADAQVGPVIVLSTSAITGAATLDEALAKAQSEFAEFKPSEPRDVTVGGIAGKQFDVTGTEGGVEVIARMTVVKPAVDRNFIVAGISPVSRWSGEIEPLYNAVVASVKFFAPVLPTMPVVPTLAPTPTSVAGEYRQWAVAAAASSEYGDPDWAAFQATGTPDVNACGDYPKSWAPSGSSTREWLALTYAVPVHVTQVNIYQTYNPDQVVKVELIDSGANYHEVYTAQPAERDCPFVLNVPVPRTDYLVTGVRITIDQSVLDLGWNEIDAVELVGVPEGPVPTAQPVPPTAVAEIPQGFIWRLDSDPGDKFYAAAGLAIGPDGNLYLADALARFHIISPDGKLLNTIQDYDHLFVTADIDVGPDGNLYIADWGSDDYPISVYTPAGKFVRAWGSKGQGEGQFGDYSPDYLAICPDGLVYVVDTNKDAADERYERVQVFDTAGNFVRQWSITAIDDFFSTAGMACHSDGNLYLLGWLGHYVLVVSPEGNLVKKIGEDALSGVNGHGLALDKSGNIYVGSWNRGVLKLDPQGNLLARWGTNTDSEEARPVGVFSYPDALVVDEAGHVYVCDWSAEYSYITKFVFP